MYAPALLSQIDFTQQPIEKFLGFVILGLVITIGYAVFRYQSASKKKRERQGTLEEELRAAEREIRELTREREKQQTNPAEQKEPEDSPDQEQLDEDDHGEEPSTETHRDEPKNR